MDELARQSDPLGNEDSWRWLHDKLSVLNRMGKLNGLLSDGRRLFCYHDAAAYKGLTFRPVLLRDGESRHFEDATVQVELGGDEYNHGFVVATCPLSARGWHPYHAGELLVFEAGRVVFSSHRTPGDPEFSFGVNGKSSDES
jgi:glutamine amidotransferase